MVMMSPPSMRKGFVPASDAMRLPSSLKTLSPLSRFTMMREGAREPRVTARDADDLHETQRAVIREAIRAGPLHLPEHGEKPAVHFDE